MHNKLVNELAVCGFNAVKAIAENHPEKVNRLFLREDRLEVFSGLCRSMAERKLPYKICDDEELERVCKTYHHQGIAAMIEEPAAVPLNRDDLDLWDRECKTGIVLHSVGNDLNLGAIVRAAAFFDVHFVVISELDECARLSTGAYRVAEGGMEFVHVRSVHRTDAFLKEASKRILVIGTDHRARRRIRDIPSLMETAENGKPCRQGMALVVGNEEAGLPQSVKDNCTALFRIPGTGFIESLNVAQASALFLHELFEL
ncbi:RNA methyltransferase [Spirochaetia bacterium]|nr:RNA methyltransferase [Spirochaetia bacterium]